MEGEASIELLDIRPGDQGWYECSVVFVDGTDDTTTNGTRIYLTVNCEYRVMIIYIPDLPTFFERKAEDLPPFVKIRQKVFLLRKVSNILSDYAKSGRY